MAVLADLLVRMGVDSAELRKGLKTAQSELKKFTRDVGQMKAALEGAFAVAGIGTAAKALSDLVMNGTKAADQMGKMAQSAGVSVTQLSALSYAARLSDVSTEELGGALGKLSKAMLGAADGTGAQADAFRALGVSVKNSDGTLRNSGDVLADIADRFAGAEDGAEKTALAIEIFGRAGAHLIPLLNQGAGGLRDMADEAQRFGFVIDDQAAKAAEQFNDNIERMKMATEGLGRQIGSQLNPALSGLASSFIDGAKSAGGMKDAADVITGALKGLASGAVAAWGALQIFAAHAAAPLAALAFAVQGKFAEAKQALANWGGSVEAESKRIKERIDAIWGKGPGSEPDIGAFNSLEAGGYQKKWKLRAPVDSDAKDKSKTEALTKWMKEFNGQVAEYERVMKSAISPTDAYLERLEEINKWSGLMSDDELARAVEEAGEEFFKASGGAARLNEEMAAFNRIVDEAERVMDDVATPVEKYRQEMERLEALLRAGAISQAQFQVAADNAAIALGRSNTVISGMADAGVDAYRSIVDAARNGANAIDALWQSLLRSFQNIVDQMVAKWIESQILMAGVNIATGGVGGGIAGGAVGGGGGIDPFASVSLAQTGSVPVASIAQASTVSEASTSITVVTPDASATARYVNGQDFSRALRQQQRRARRRGTV